MVYLPHWPIPSTLGKREIDYETVFERMSLVLERLGNPHKKMPPIIHVAGTNGKGSATSLLAKIFSCAGYKTHIYTSPHLHDCNERIVLNGEKISDSFLYEILEETRLATDQTPLTFMEAFTIAAFVAFAKVPSDVVVIECGMGGRIDATNIFEEKLLTLIMPISFDHMEYLGNSIERIALEKAMIMRKETPLVVAAQPSAAKNIIKILAADQKIPAFFYDEDFAIELNFESGEFDFRDQNNFFENLPKPSLPGLHQYVNFATAIAAATILQQKFSITETHIRQAISSVYWPSRLEKVSGNLNKILKNPESEIWIDGAHNEAGAFACARWLEEETKKDGKENFVICGFSKNKCKKEFLEKFRDVAKLTAVRVDGEPYPEDTQKIVEIGAKNNLQISAASDLSEAIYNITQNTTNSCRILICGSLHLARDVRKFSKSNYK
jgi:dihydrofolate synthase/folylpolyglutamate synthase